MSKITCKALDRLPQARNGSANRTNRRLMAAAAILTASLMGGCASFETDHFRVGSIPSDYRTKHPIIVSTKDVVRELPVTSNTGELSLRNDSIIREFAANYRTVGAKNVRIVVPHGSRNEMAARRIARMASMKLQEYGVPARDMRIIGYQARGTGDAATIKLVYRALEANVAEECGKWDDDLTFDPENRNYHNYGCATQNNLAKMVASPADLVTPRGQDEIDAERRDNVISDWRNSGT